MDETNIRIIRGELAKWRNSCSCVCEMYFCTDMSSSSLLILLLCAPIVGQIPVPLNATVGGSILIPCSLPVNSTSIKWFYWQEDGSDKLLFHWHISEKTVPVADEYRNRCQVFNNDFSSGNISIRLNNVSVGDDQKTFSAFVGFYSTKPLEHQCESSLQVSAAYQDLNLTINSTLNTATCMAHGGYPEPEVSWTGQNKSSGEQLKLKDAQTSHQQHPTKKTFSVTSTVSVKELQSVTCLVYNPRSKQQIENTTVIDAPGEELLSTIGVSIGVIAALLFLFLVYFVYRKCQDSNQRLQQAVNQEDSAANEVPANGNAPHAPSNSSEGQESQEGPQQAVNQEDSAAGGVLAGKNAPVASSNSSEGQESQEGPQQAEDQEDSAATVDSPGRNAPVASSNSSEDDVSEGKVLINNQDGWTLKTDAKGVPSAIKSDATGS
ncbi:CD276 antigen-like isoform X2 [Thunnus thynnus]|uniref:CD276 antigen-like isoform X2 n=1 Tax=Thunnus thynnus TaxID=8237 RepID=UPI0035293347